MYGHHLDLHVSTPSFPTDALPISPSLAQQDFAQTSTSINLVGGVYIPVLTKIVKTNSAVAQALGAQPLKPEKSKNYSLGFTLTPASGLSLPVDAYPIDLSARIPLTGIRKTVV